LFVSFAVVIVLSDRERKEITEDLRFIFESVARYFEIGIFYLEAKTLCQQKKFGR